MRLFIVANQEKEPVKRATKEICAWLDGRAQIVGVTRSATEDLAAIEADTVLVLGGDGTLLSAARRLGGRAIPLMGVNFGRLGFLASFTPDNWKGDLEALLAGKLTATRRMMLHVSVVDGGRAGRFVSTALNDAVITAGPPFHMIELQLSVDGEPPVSFFGDGAIVSTPSGSTAYNASAGGPIVNPAVEAMCITPICPHSLSFRPVVIPAASRVAIVAVKVNEGTTLFCDGQDSVRLQEGDQVLLRRSEHDVLLIENPQAGQWRSLAEKLHWAVSPTHASGR
mgnify:CR=1 FL=1